jgi:hypothetical protein
MRTPSKRLTDVQRARDLGISDRTIRLWKSSHHDFPHGADSDELREWAEARGLNRIYIRGDGILAELQKQLLRAQIEHKKFKLAQLRGDLIPRHQVQARLQQFVTRLAMILRQKFEVELGPRCAGKTIDENNAEGLLILAEITGSIEADIDQMRRDFVDRPDTDVA